MLYILGLQNEIRNEKKASVAANNKCIDCTGGVTRIKGKTIRDKHTKQRNVFRIFTENIACSYEYNISL